MRRRYGGVSISRETRWIIVFFVGLLAGTFFFNLWGKNSLEEMILYKGIVEEKYIGTIFSYIELFWYILWKRGRRLAVLLLLEFTVFGIPALLLYALYYGFATGLFLSSFVMQYGLQGILIFFIWIFPHYIVYGMVWWILTMKKDVWTFQRRLLIIFGFFLLGIFLESSINVILIQKILL